MNPLKGYMKGFIIHNKSIKGICEIDISFWWVHSNTNIFFSVGMLIPNMATNFTHSPSEMRFFMKKDFFVTSTFGSFQIIGTSQIVEQPDFSTS